jgi:hypothetical protein
MPKLWRCEPSCTYIRKRTEFVERENHKTKASSKQEELREESSYSTVKQKILVDWGVYHIGILLFPFLVCRALKSIRTIRPTTRRRGRRDPNNKNHKTPVAVIFPFDQQNPLPSHAPIEILSLGETKKTPKLYAMVYAACKTLRSNPAVARRA